MGAEGEDGALQAVCYLLGETRKFAVEDRKKSEDSLPDS